MSDVMLREHQIRPADTTQEQQRRYEADVARLLLRRSEFVDVPCPACGGTQPKYRFSKYSLPFFECPRCSTMYLTPRPTPALLREYYETSTNYAYWADAIFPPSEATRREQIFRPRVRQVLDLCGKYGVARGSLLEVGPGFGTFCEELVSTGAFKRVLGVEPTPSLAAACRSRGIEIVESPIEDVELPELVDVVASFEVIEHLFDPSDFVKRCARVLRPGGLLILTCPNGKGFDIEVMGPGSPAVDVEHLNYFNPASLAGLLERNGFEVVETLTPGRLDADIVRNRALAGEFTIREPFLVRVLLDDWARVGGAFQRFLVEQGMSSNMWAVGRRR